LLYFTIDTIRVPALHYTVTDSGEEGKSGREKEGKWREGKRRGKMREGKRRGKMREGKRRGKMEGGKTG
jgi:hypothetical protein